MADAGVPELVWSMSDGKAGHASQARALAEAMFPSGATIVPKVVRVGLGQMLRALLPAWGSPEPRRLCAECVPPWPGLVVSCSRRASVAALAVKRRSRARVVQVVRPFRDQGLYDAVVVPHHDRMGGPNVVRMHGSVVDGARIAGLGRQEAKGRFAGMPGKKVALLVGGASRAFDFGPDACGDLASRVGEAARREGMVVLAVTSRRTFREADETLRRGLSPTDYVWDGSGDNPYWEIIAAASVIVVTGDSVNMVSEACASGRPTYVCRLPVRSARRAAKIARFHRDLETMGAARMFESDLEPWSAERLDELPRVAREVLRLIGG